MTSLRSAPVAAACSLLATYAVENYPLELAFLKSR